MSPLLIALLSTTAAQAARDTFPLKATWLSSRSIIMSRAAPNDTKSSAPNTVVISDSFRRSGGNRHYQDQSGRSLIYSSIGLVQSQNLVTESGPEGSRQGFSQGTAFLVSPCIIATNYHVVFGSEVPSSDPHAVNGSFHYAVDFSVGATASGLGFKYLKIRATPFAWGRPSEDNRWSMDWAFLKLDSDKCVGNDPEIGWLTLKSIPSDGLEKRSLSTAGYPRDMEPSDNNLQSKLLVKVDSCKLTLPVPYNDLYLSDCIADHGASGSPVFYADGLNSVVVGLLTRIYEIGKSRVNKRFFEKTTGTAGFAILLMEDISKEMTRVYGGDIAAVIESDIARHRNPNYIFHSDENGSISH